MANGILVPGDIARRMAEIIRNPPKVASKPPRRVKDEDDGAFWSEQMGRVVYPKEEPR